MQQPDPAQIQQMLAVMMPMMVIFGLLGAAIVVVPFWMIFKKAGLGGPLSLLMLIPLVGIVMLYVLAFSRWKVVPAPEYPLGYSTAYPPPPPGYSPAVYPPAAYPSATPVPPAGTAASPAYVPPQDPPATV